MLAPWNNEKHKQRSVKMKQNVSVILEKDKTKQIPMNVHKW